MKTEYIYAVRQRVWADEVEEWLFSEPLCDHGVASEIFDLSLDEGGAELSWYCYRREFCMIQSERLACDAY